MMAAQLAPNIRTQGSAQYVCALSGGWIGQPAAPDPHRALPAPPPPSLQGLLGSKQGAVMRTGEDSASKAPWKILYQLDGKFVQVGTMWVPQRCVSGDDVSGGCTLHWAEWARGQGSSHRHTSSGSCMQLICTCLPTCGCRCYHADRLAPCLGGRPPTTWSWPSSTRQQPPARWQTPRASSRALCRRRRTSSSAKQ